MSHLTLGVADDLSFEDQEALPKKIVKKRRYGVGHFMDGLGLEGFRTSHARVAVLILKGEHH
jgi:hypothetical protein